VGNPNSSIGLIAGWGDYPSLVARAARARGHRIVGAGLRGHAEPHFADACDKFRWFGLGQLGGIISYFRRNGVTQATMAGKVHKVKLFQPWNVVRHWPDMVTFSTFFHHFITAQKDRRDDTLLLAVVRAFQDRGITIVPATDFAPDLLLPECKLTRRGPTRRQLADIEFGWRLAREMGRLDIGQSVCVKGQAVLAVEAIEGTDACIRRAGQLCGAGGFTVVKVAKPEQDMRFDVPTIGIHTLESMTAAGASVLAVEAGRTIAVHQPELAAFANRHGLAILALPSPERCRPEWIAPDAQAA
jgi:DUF1009 family protein